MSRASKRTKKEKRMRKEGMKIPIYCPNCNVPIGENIYKTDRPWEYVCLMCGKEAFPELKKRIELNEAYNLFKELERQNKD